MPTTHSKQKRPDNLVESYVHALVSGDERAGESIVQQAMSQGWTLGDVYSNLLTPAHNRIEELVQKRAMTRAHFHLATQMTLSHMGRLRSRLPTHPARGHRILVAVIEGDEQQLGALMIADVFRADGWAVDLIGRSVPLKDLLQLLKERKPEVAVISSDVGIRSEKFRKLVRGVRRFAQPPTVILGGTGFDRNGGNGSEIPGVHVARNLEEVLKIGKDVVASTASDFTLEGFLKTLGGRIRETRRGLSLTQQQLAEKAKLDRTYIVAVEQGRQNVTVGAVMRIAEALGVSMDRLLVSDKVSVVEGKGGTQS